VNGYLMDTNHVTEWEAQNPVLVARVKSLPTTDMIFTSAITLGEIAAGHEMTPGGDLHRRHLVRQFLNLNCIPNTVSVSHYTESYYGKIMGRLWKRKPPASRSVPTETHLRNLGVDINDVWIVACAWEHGLTLLTSDSMTPIRDVTPEVTFENWCV